MDLLIVGGAPVWRRHADPVLETFFLDEDLFVQRNLRIQKSGVRLAPGQSDEALFSFDTGLLTCGMYEVELTVDSEDVVAEGRMGELDNVTRHYLFMENKRQDFSIRKRLPQLITSWKGQTPLQAFAQFDVFAPAGSPPIFRGFAHTQRSPGVAMDTIPAPSNAPIAIAPMNGPEITMRFSYDPPLVPWPPIEEEDFFGIPRVNTGKVTLISQDGCIIRQRSASLTVEP